MPRKKPNPEDIIKKLLLKIQWKTRNELLNGEILYTLKEPGSSLSNGVFTNTVRPNSSLAYRPPAPQVVMTRPLPFVLLTACALQ